MLVLAKKYIILGSESGEDRLYGYAEDGAGYQWSDSYARVFWTGRSNTFGKMVDHDGLEQAEDKLYQLRQGRRQWVMSVWDLESKDLPVEVDVAAWVAANAASRFKSWETRNAPFRMGPGYKPVSRGPTHGLPRIDTKVTA